MVEINAVQQSSTEIFEDIFNKLNSLGMRGKNVLDRLNQKLSSDVLPNRNTSVQVTIFKITRHFHFISKVLSTFITL